MREIHKLEKRNRKLIQRLWRLEKKNNNLKNRVDQYKPIDWKSQNWTSHLDAYADMQNYPLIKAACELYDP